MSPDYAVRLDAEGRQLRDRAQRAQGRILVALCGSGLAAALPYKLTIGSDEIALGSSFAALFVLVSLLLGVFLVEDGTAADAESALSVARHMTSESWKFAVGSQGYSRTLGDPAARRKLSRVLQGLVMTHGRALARLQHLEAPPQVNQPMTELRLRSLDERRSRYLAERLDVAVDSDDRDLRRLRQRARHAQILARSAQVLMLGLAIAQAVQVLDVDLVGAVGAVSASAVAWLGFLRVEREAEALGSRASASVVMRDRLLAAADEPEWAALVEECEAIMIVRSQ